MKKIIIKFLVSFGFMGEFPYASGTVASFAGLLLYLSLIEYPLVQLVVFLLLFVLGLFLTPAAEKIFGVKDPHEIVLDEVACLYIVFIQIPISLNTLIVGFLLYRLFDIVKPPPARRLEKLYGGWGVMLDDCMAGLYANISLRLLLVWLNFF